MARRIRSPKLETRSARLKLPLRGKPYYTKLAEGLHLGYRRNEGPGSWSIRKADGRGSNWIKVIAPADDYDGVAGALSYWDAQARARELALGTAADDGTKLQTVAEAIEAYRADLKARGGEEANALRLLPHLPASHASKIVAALNSRELRHWRDGLLDKGLTPGSVTRYCKSLAAALSLAAAHDPRIKNRDAWRIGLAALPDAANTRNVILSDTEVRHIVQTAYTLSQALGTLLELAAVTGARPSQLKRLVVSDVQKNRLMMPSSKKGKGKRRIEHRPVPIPETLALRLKQLGKGRSPDAALLLRDEGMPWSPTGHRDPMRAIVTAAGLDPGEVTIYALRHSSIVRQLLKGTPIRVVATAHDTSVAMIEKTYSKYISDHADDLLRAGLIDLSAPPDGDKVVRLR
jgi:integrase